MLPCTRESYCSQTQRLAATFGAPSTRTNASRASTVTVANVGSSLDALRAASGGGERAFVHRPLVRERAGRDVATISPPSEPRARRQRTTVADDRGRSPHRSQTACTSSSRSGATIASIRSWDSEVRISKGSIPASRSGTASRSSSAPMPARAADSLTAQVSPAPPRSCSPSSSPCSTISSEASINSFSANGSPICTLGRDSSAPSSSVALARTDTPPIPSRPVAAPYRTMSDPSCTGRALVTRRSAGAIPTHITFTLGFEECGSANAHLAADRRHADAVAVAADAGDHAGEQPAVPLVGERAEPERIQQRDRPRAHRDDVAHDAADARSPRPGTARSRSGASGSRS